MVVKSQHGVVTLNLLCVNGGDPAGLGREDLPSCLMKHSFKRGNRGNV